MNTEFGLIAAKEGGVPELDGVTATQDQDMGLRQCQMHVLRLEFRRPGGYRARLALISSVSQSQ